MHRSVAGVAAWRLALQTDDPEVAHKSGCGCERPAVRSRGNFETSEIHTGRGSPGTRACGPGCAASRPRPGRPAPRRAACAPRSRDWLGSSRRPPATDGACCSERPRCAGIRCASATATEAPPALRWPSAGSRSVRAPAARAFRWRARAGRRGCRRSPRMCLDLVFAHGGEELAALVVNRVDA